jgi:hypothetical protein
VKVPLDNGCQRDTNESKIPEMLIAVLVFMFFALLAIAYELHGITQRLIETGTIIEHFNRRDLRKSGIRDTNGDDFASESISATHLTWRQTVWGIVVASLLSIGIIKLVAGIISWIARPG